MSLSVSFPRLRSLVKMPSKRSAGRRTSVRQATRARVGSPVTRRTGRRRTPRGRTRRGRPTPSPTPTTFTGMPELRLDREHDAALGGAVELGEHDAGHVDRLGELLAPARGRSGRSSRRARAAPPCSAPGGAVDDAAELLQLVHEVDLGVQPARGVDEHEVGVAARRPRSSRRTPPSPDRRPPARARCSAPVRSAQCASCSAAAARNVSAAASTTALAVVDLRAARAWRSSWSCRRR